MNAKKESHKFYDIPLRYLLVFIASLGNLGLFYFIFTPLTFYPSAFFLQMFYDTVIMDNFIFIGQAIIEISKSCVAGSAYYLLLMLNFITAGITLRKRASLFLISSSLFLLLNVARILFLAVLKIHNFIFFETLHIIFWYFVSIIYVFLVWIFSCKMLKITAIPFYSDFLYIKNLGKSSKPKKVKKSKRR